MAFYSQPAIRKFGPPTGASGIEVIERQATSPLSDPKYGTVAMFGNLRRGPMDVAIPVNGKNNYTEIYGDPRDISWHLFKDGSHLMPDAIDGFFSTGQGYGTLWVTRIKVENARKAELIFKGRNGLPVLKIFAANEGRWAGMNKKTMPSPVVFATNRTFALILPGTFVNEYIDAIVEFSQSPGIKYTIVANTAADGNGEVIFTLSSQYSLVQDGISGPMLVSSTASYAAQAILAGTVVYPLKNTLSGTISTNGKLVYGNNQTRFTTELSIGSILYVDDGGTIIVKVVDYIENDQTLTVSAAFTGPLTNVTVQTNNFVVTGDGTSFSTALKAGDKVSFNFGTTDSPAIQTREVAAVISDTEIKLVSGFDQAIAGNDKILTTNNKTIVFTGTAAGSQVSVGDYIIDPFAREKSVKVVSVTTVTDETNVVIDRPFPSAFSNIRLARQAQTAQVILEQPKNTGISVEIAQGSRFPDTHFGLKVMFNQSTIMSIPDASLDPDDPYFIEPLVNDNNLAYQDGSNNYQTWITVESLWTSTYTTIAGMDVRPCNDAGTILEINKEYLYTISDIDYNSVAGNMLFPNPYNLPRGSIRVKSAKKPMSLTGTVSSALQIVTGAGTQFTTEAKVGDYLYDPSTRTVSKITSIVNDTQLTIETAFTTSMAVGTKAMIAGWMAVETGYDLFALAGNSRNFFVSYPQTLSGGYDGDTANLMPYHFLRYADLDRNFLENAVFGRNMGLIRIACPGISDVATQKGFAAYAEGKAFEFRGEIPSSYNTAALAEIFVNQMLGRNDFMILSFPSYGFISNPFAAGQRYVPISGDIMGGESYKSVIHEGYHHVFAGVNAALSRVLKLPFQPTAQDEAVLNSSGIQPVKYLSGNAVLFGARGASLSQSYDFNHIRRIQSNYIRLFLEARTLMELMFTPNQPNLVEQIVMMMNNFARREYRKGVFTKFLNFEQSVKISAGELQAGENRVVSDDKGKDALVEVINGKLAIYFSYVPTGILERLSINCGPDILVASYGSSPTNSI